MIILSSLHLCLHVYDGFFSDSPTVTNSFHVTLSLFFFKDCIWWYKLHDLWFSFSCPPFFFFCRWGGSALSSLWGNFLWGNFLMNRRGDAAAQQGQLSNSQTSSCFWTSRSHNAVTDVGSWHTWSPPVGPPELEISCFFGHGSTRAALRMWSLSHLTALSPSDIRLTI